MTAHTCTRAHTHIHTHTLSLTQMYRHACMLNLTCHLSVYCVVDILFFFFLWGGWEVVLQHTLQFAKDDSTRTHACALARTHTHTHTLFSFLQQCKWAASFNFVYFFQMFTPVLPVDYYFVFSLPPVLLWQLFSGVAAEGSMPAPPGTNVSSRAVLSRSHQQVSETRK